MKNWKSTLGGAVAAFGTFLFGAPVVINSVSPDFPKPFMVACMATGFILQGVGIFFGHLFSADAKEVKTMAAQVQENSSAILTGDTTHLRKSQTQEPKS